MKAGPVYSGKREGTAPCSSEGLPVAPAVGTVAGDAARRGNEPFEELVSGGQATFLLRVNCCVMTESGINRGDIVIVDRSLVAANGKIVIAVLNGDLLIRRFERTNNHISLLADANRLSPITIDDTCRDFALWGVVTGVVRQL